MLATKNYKFWFCTGSQDLYGDECLANVAEHSKIIVEKLNASGLLPYEVVWKPTLITNEVIRKTFNEANNDDDCAGVIVWCHTFSPAKSWILGLKELRKPLLHLHTQFNEEIPYDTIDMDFMNENQSAHGDREWGHMVSRMRMERKVVVGHWNDDKVKERIGSWMRTAVGIIESSHIRVMRVADNMRNVAVTEGDKVEAQLKFGWEIDAYPVNEIAEAVDAVSQADVDTLVEEYYSKYDILLEGRDPQEFRKHVAVQAKIELGFERFLEEKNYHAIVTHFGDLGALQQLPGLAIQRLMEKGYGFGAEGDWKVAAMVRLMKIMTAGVKDAKGTSMLEDYTYNLVKGKEGILQAHMLEICPTIAEGPISIKCNPLSMGNREDPARLVFTSKEGKGIATSLIDLGNRFRLIINDVDCKKVEKPMPKLPVATNFWTPQPDFYTGCEAWILAGGAHHTAFSYDLTSEQMGDWANAMGIEALYIDKDTTIRNFKKDIMLGEVFYR
ncbi:MAG: L-arabinose isomerase [Agathobacter sp.]